MKTTIETDAATSIKIPKPTHVTVFCVNDPSGDTNNVEKVGKAKIDLSKYCEVVEKTDFKI